MPGKKEGAGSYTFMSATQLHRSVSAADSVSQAAIEAISEVIDLANDVNDGEPISIGRENVLLLGVLFPTAVTSVTVQVFVDMKGTLSVSNNWALVQEETLTFSGHIDIKRIYPGPCKVLVTALAGAGTVEIVYSKSS